MTKKEKEKLDQKEKIGQEVARYLEYRNSFTNAAGLSTKDIHKLSVQEKVKSKTRTMFVSATPSRYELELSDKVVEQIIRPTGLLDPIVYVYPKSGDMNLLINSADNLVNKKPYMKKYLESDFSHVEHSVLEEKEILAIQELDLDEMIG